MSISTYSGATDFIAQLPDKPVTDGGYTAQTFKQEFDKFGTQFKYWFNTTFVPALNNTFQTIISGSNKVSGAYIADESITETQINNVNVDGHLWQIHITQDAPQDGDADGIYLVY